MKQYKLELHMKLGNLGWGASKKTKTICIKTKKIKKMKGVFYITANVYVVLGCLNQVRQKILKKKKRHRNARVSDF